LADHEANVRGQVHGGRLRSEACEAAERVDRWARAPGVERVQARPYLNIQSLSRQLQARLRRRSHPAEARSKTAPTRQSPVSSARIVVLGHFEVNQSARTASRPAARAPATSSAPSPTKSACCGVTSNLRAPPAHRAFPQMRSTYRQFARFDDICVGGIQLSPTRLSPCVRAPLSLARHSCTACCWISR